MKDTPIVATPTVPMPIDAWFAEQDRAIEAELKVVKRNIRRRKFDRDEMERRINARMAAEQEELALQIAIARAVVRAYGYATVADQEHNFKDELKDGLERRMPGTTFNDYVINTRPCRTDEEKYRYREDGSTCSNHYWQVREDVVKEMRLEAEARQPGTSVRREPEAETKAAKRKLVPAGSRLEKLIEVHEAYKRLRKTGNQFTDESAQLYLDGKFDPGPYSFEVCETVIAGRRIRRLFIDGEELCSLSRERMFPEEVIARRE